MTRHAVGKRDPLEIPWTRRELQELLARGQKTQAELAERYGVSQPAISKFKTRHQATIDRILEDHMNSFADIELSEKVSRIETYQELAQIALEAGELKTVAHMLRSVAEELGQLPNRVTVESAITLKTRYEIVGVENDDLT